MRSFLSAALVGWAGLSALAQGRSQAHLDYFATYAPLAVAEMQAHGIPASITLAQGLLESGAGESALARQSNNHFGIKCPGGWTGPTHHAEDDDYRDGRLVKSCFRAYSSAADSYADHSAFLVNSPRYAGLFELKPHDYRGWARGLKRAGYATSRTYATRLIELIDRYELTQYDRGDVGLPLGREVLAANTTALPAALPAAPTSPPATRPARRTPGGLSAKPTEHTTPTDLVRNVNDVDYAVAMSGETLGALAARTGRGVRELTRYNEGLRRGSALHTGQRVFLQPKRNSFRGKSKHHRVGQDETLQTIADAYGLSTRALRERNGIGEDEEPRPRTRLTLRGRRRRSDVVSVVPAGQRYAALAGRRQRSGAVAEAPRRTATPRPASRRQVEVIRPAPVQRATAPVSAPAVEPAVAAMPTIAPVRRVVVSPGDTLYAISRAHGVSVAAIREWNGLSGNVIRVGQELVVGE